MQHVLKDKRVLAFAQKHAAEEEGDEISTNEWDLENAYVSIHQHIFLHKYTSAYFLAGNFGEH